MHNVPRCILFFPVFDYHMTDQYTAKYTDANGAEDIVIFNDGTTLRMVVGGVTFEDTMFDSFEPVEGTDALLLRRFTLHHNILCHCRIECDIPIAVMVNGERSTGILSCRLDFGPPGEKAGVSSGGLGIILKHDSDEYISSGTSGWFEDELLDIQKQLPADMFMKVCINCLFSDYSPVGNGMFGCMYCYRNMKSEYLKVKTKSDYLELFGRAERTVQETYLCDDFEIRVPGTGYRG